MILPPLMAAGIALLFGLLIGSFLNVCIYRLPRDLSVVRPRSHCPGCETMIAGYDNIPLVSFFILRGKCRHCGEEIPWRYPLVELATGIVFAVIVYVLGFTLPALKYCIYAAILVDLIATDLAERILPDEFTLGGTVIGLVLAAFVPMPGFLAWLVLPASTPQRWVSVTDAVISAGFVSGGMWLFAWVYQKVRHREGGWMGLGDVKMLAMIGAFAGMPEVLLVVIVAAVLSMVIGLPYILMTRNKVSEYELPFGSFIGLAALGMAVWGDVIATWYGRLGR
jgi:leader peptidase (prepilin peptidase) / N-methyltransferase